MDFKEKFAIWRLTNKSINYIRKFSKNVEKFVNESAPASARNLLLAEIHSINDSMESNFAVMKDPTFVNYPGALDEIEKIRVFIHSRIDRLKEIAHSI